MYLLNIFIFFTNWALVIHILYLLNIIKKNTLFLASYVLIGSIIHNFTFNEQYNLLIDIYTHYIPFFITFYYCRFNDFLTFEFIYFIIPYLIMMNFDIYLIYDIYKRPNDAMFKYNILM